MYGRRLPIPYRMQDCPCISDAQILHSGVDKRSLSTAWAFTGYNVPGKLWLGQMLMIPAEKGLRIIWPLRTKMPLCRTEK